MKLLVPLEPPEGSRVGTDYGFACDPRIDLKATFPAQPRKRHQGCAGWWPSGTGGWCCPCDCHAHGAGWPGYERAARRVSASH